MTTLETVASDALDRLGEWYDGQRQSPDREPLRFVAAVGLVITEHLRSSFPLYDDVIVTPGNQVRQQSQNTVQGILRRYGEERVFLAEGGRTTRNAVTVARDLAARLNGINDLAELTVEQRAKLADTLQIWLVGHVREHFNQERIAPDVDVTATGPELVAAVLAAARERGKAGAVAQHLVGAKLALRYPNEDIENHSFTTADVQLGRHGDFQINDTVFHVTVAPSLGHVQKCRQNLGSGFRVVAVVPTDSEVALRQLLALQGVTNRVWVARLEDFVGQNIEELSDFAQQRYVGTIRQLLELYNERVVAVETDRSLLIHIPENLR